MSRSTISMYQLFQLIPDEDSARAYLEDRLWPNGVTCPECKATERITARQGARAGYFLCGTCKLEFTVRTNTIFGRSKIPLHKWVYAMYALVTARKGVSSLQLAKEIGVTQKSAWFMLQRLREAMSAPGSQDKLRGIVEIDECFIGGKEANKHEHKKLRMGRGAVGKTAVLGMRERGGRTVAITMGQSTVPLVTRAIYDTVTVGTQLYTDNHMVFSDLENLFYKHASVNHAAGEYARGPVSTNGIESVWAVLKRGIHGVYHQVSAKHLSRYVNEFAFRLNDGKVTRHTLDRLNSFVDAVAGKRLTYKALTA